MYVCVCMHLHIHIHAYIQTDMHTIIVSVHHRKRCATAGSRRHAPRASGRRRGCQLREKLFLQGCCRGLNDNQQKLYRHQIGSFLQGYWAVHKGSLNLTVLHPTVWVSMSRITNLLLPYPKYDSNSIRHLKCTQKCYC